jgi:hypothetical protein
MDMLRMVEQIVQCITAGTGNHNNAAVRIKLQELAVTARVFPARIVNQLTLMNAAEYPVAQMVDVLHSSVVLLLLVKTKLLLASKLQIKEM